MKKILICMMVLAMLFSMTAFAATRDEALSAAQEVISAEDPDAQLVESDEDDGCYEFEFASDTARYDVLVDRDGSYELRNDFRDHDLMKKTLKGMLE